MSSQSWLRLLSALFLVSAAASPGTAGPAGGDFTPGWIDTTADRNFLRNDNSAGGTNLDFVFKVGNQALVHFFGDWDGDGDFTPGFYDPGANRWFLRNANSGGTPDSSFIFGVTGTPVNVTDMIPVVGDWDGSGSWTIGFFDRLNNRWFLRNTNSNGAPDLDFFFGVSAAPTPTTQPPVVGDWDGDGSVTVGFYNSSNFRWDQRNSNSGGAVNASFVYNVGQPGSNLAHVVGDWDANGSYTPGYVMLSVNRWMLRNANSGGAPDLNFVYSVKAPLTPDTFSRVGDWDGTTTP